MPAFCVQPNRSPEGLSRSIASVSGSWPVGPGAWLEKSKSDGSPSKGFSGIQDSNNYDIRPYGDILNAP